MRRRRDARCRCCFRRPCCSGGGATIPRSLRPPRRRPDRDCSRNRRRSSCGGSQRTGSNRTPSRGSRVLAEGPSPSWTAGRPRHTTRLPPGTGPGRSWSDDRRRPCRRHGFGACRPRRGCCCRCCRSGCCRSLGEGEEHKNEVIPANFIEGVTMGASHCYSHPFYSLIICLYTKSSIYDECQTSAKV